MHLKLKNAQKHGVYTKFIGKNTLYLIFVINLAHKYLKSHTFLLLVAKFYIQIPFLPPEKRLFQFSSKIQTQCL